MSKIAHPGFLVWNPKAPQAPTFVHYGLETAKAEARRLANKHRGQKFFIMAPVLVAIGDILPPPPVTLSLVADPLLPDLDDEIPF